MSDALSDGPRYRMLNIVDESARECLAAVVDTSLSGARVVREVREVVRLVTVGGISREIGERRGLGT